MSAGAIAFASWLAYGSAACPGPPASASTALWLGMTPAGFCSTLSEIVPGTAPVRSSGTAAVAQEKPALLRQGANASVASAAGTGADASAAVSSGVASIRVSVRRDIDDTLAPGRREWLRLPGARRWRMLLGAARGPRVRGALAADRRSGDSR